MEIKFKSLVSLVLLSSVLISCGLEEEPYGFYSEDNFYTTEADAKAAVDYAYDSMTFLEYSRAIFYLGDMPTDECGPKSDEATDNQDLHNWNVSNFNNNRMLSNFFKYGYIAINRANSVIKNIPEGDYDQSVKDQFLGEGYFLRGYNYFNLVRVFGNVPIHRETVESVNQTNAPLSEDLDEIYDLIIADCEKAIDLLGINQRLGRADKVAAQFLLAKVYLTIASSKANNVPLYSEMNKDTQEMYQLAVQYSGEVINGQSIYGFVDNLIDIYDVEQPLGDENILLLSMDRSGTIEGDYSKISKLFIPYIDGATLYLKNPDGSYTKSHDGFSVFQTKLEFYNDYQDNDLRKTALIVDTTYNELGEVSATYPESIVYPFCRKYVDPNFIGDKTSTKPFLMRYSEAALIYAEAAGPTPKAYAQVNYIRNRAGIGELNPGLGLDAFRSAILEERKYELAFEGNRLYDLRRFNRLVVEVPEASGITPEQAAFYPIPQTEIDLNTGL